MLGVGDDCALVDVSNGMDLAVSTDTMVSGTHFFPDVDPENLGHKALAVNLSDMAAMGAMPYWAMLALTLPAVDHEWLAAFAKGFFDLAEEFNVSLIGGDTTRGPLTLTVTIMGEVPAGAALRRSGAKAGNDIWVSGNIGDAALAVAHRHGKLVLTERDYREAVMRLYEPTPRVALGQALRGLATSRDRRLRRPARGPGPHLHALGRGRHGGAGLDPASRPSARGTSTSDAGRTAIVAGGDDYELCFTAHRQLAREHRRISPTCWACPLTRIGQVKRGKGVSLLGTDGKPMKIDGRGFDHFSGP